MNPADLMTKPVPKPKIEQLMSLMGHDFVKGETGALKGRAGGEMRLQLEIFREYLGAILARLMKGHSAAKSGKVAAGDSIVDSPCGRQCCTSREGVHRVTPNFTIRRRLDEKKWLEELKAECQSPVKFLTVIRVGVRHVPEGKCLRAAQ